MKVLPYGSRVMHFDMDDHFAEVEKVVSQFKYKDGWTFSVKNEYDVVMFTGILRGVVPHPKAPLSEHDDLTIIFKVSLGHLSFVDSIETGTLQGLRLLIRQGELHEMDEWCEYKGERRWNPHERNSF